MLFKKGFTPWNKGLKGIPIKHSKQFKKGHKTWNKGLKGYTAKSGPNKRGWTKEEIKKMLKRNPKSSLEIKFEGIIQKYNLPYKFVGNGEFLIGKKCPDFVNTNGQKIAIEVYYRRHKELFRGGLQNWTQQRQKLFEEYGWDLLFFDEIQVNEKNILKTIGGG